MVDELREVFERAQQQSEDVQRVIAALVERELDRARQDAEHPAAPRTSYAGAWSDLPEDDEVETLHRMRHAVPPTPSVEDQLRWLDEA